jgi:hypothetical protein
MFTSTTQHANLRAIEVHQIVAAGITIALAVASPMAEDETAARPANSDEPAIHANYDSKA